MKRYRLFLKGGYYKLSDFTSLVKLRNHATGCASQHIWCLSKARINWEGCARKGIRHKNGGDGRDGDTN